MTQAPVKRIPKATEISVCMPSAVAARIGPPNAGVQRRAGWRAPCATPCEAIAPVRTPARGGTPGSVRCNALFGSSSQWKLKRLDYLIVIGCETHLDSTRLLINSHDRRNVQAIWIGEYRIFAIR